MFIKTTFLLVSLAFSNGEPIEGSLVKYERYLTKDTCEHMATHLIEVINASPELIAMNEEMGVDQLKVACVEEDHSADYKEL